MLSREKKITSRNRQPSLAPGWVVKSLKLQHQRPKEFVGAPSNGQRVFKSTLPPRRDYRHALIMYPVSSGPLSSGPSSACS